MDLEKGKALAVSRALEALSKSEWSQAGDDWNLGRFTGLTMALDIFEAVYNYELNMDKK